MGGEVRWTKRSIEKRLREGWDQYRDHENAGDDMAEAGQELARVVWRIVGPPPPCALPRNMVLERSSDPALEEVRKRLL